MLTLLCSCDSNQEDEEQNKAIGSDADGWVLPCSETNHIASFRYI
jgi:hypothetical protein